MSSGIFYCPFCGAQNKETNQFCSNCGAQLANDAKTPSQLSAVQETVPPSFSSTSQSTQPVYQQPLSPQQPTTVVYTSTSQPVRKQVTATAVFGFVLGLIDFLFLSWFSWFVPIWWVTIFLIITVVGIVLSAKSIKTSPGFGITGLVLGIIAALPQIVAFFILIVWLSIF